MLRRVIRRVLADLLIVFFSYSTTVLAFHLTGSEDTGIMPVSWYWVIIAGLYISVNAIFRFYSRIWGTGSVIEPLWLLVSSGISTLTLFAVHQLAFPVVDLFDLLAVYVIAGVLTCTGFLLIRYRLFLWRRLTHQPDRKAQDGQNRVLIVGMNREAQQLAVHLDRDENRRFRVVGFIDHNARHRQMRVVRWSVLGLPADIPQITEEKKVDIVLIVQNGLNGIGLTDLINLCQKTVAQIKILPDGLDVLNDCRWDLSKLRDVTVEDLLKRAPAVIDEVMCRSIIENKVVLVTGASGSIGSELCRQIINYNPARLIMLDNNESELHDLGVELGRKLDHKRFHTVLADITNATKMKELFETTYPHIVFHAAAYKHVPMLEQYPEEAVRINILGTMILSEYAARYDVERFIFISTDKAVNPLSVMGASKRICELWLKALNRITGRTTYTIVRFGNVIGSRGSVVPIFNRQIAWGGPVTVTHKDMTRYFMSIPESVSLVLHAMTLCSRSETYMLDMGKRISIYDLAQQMIRVRGLRVNVDIPIHITGIRPGEKMHEELYYGNEIRQPTSHSRIYGLSDPAPGPELTTILGAILLLADVAQRQNVDHILRRAIVIAAFQDWDTLIQLVRDMDLLETYQPPAVLLGNSVLLDYDVVESFIREYSSNPIVQEAD